MISIDEINKLKEENAKLNAIIDGYQPKIQALKEENERLKEENFNFEEIVKLCRCEQYQQTLQEIKEIAESIGNEEMINGYAIRAKSALWQIANKITAEEE